ncbi:hypothetical protein C2869_16390 [Saccharobesus litoralis]|uniref:Solute-binding protein family 3/N-terminal domain-containing protein n=1 Tax=Saccharobesus litoralis TaxID=2172099 RepID=A0A2S0VUN1_9ALTE|nr:transporter substrate-binding domain-containing protein [Saccharobesus litoralis]AWB67905.1 hypothetical protein C2869_16390 [Saccharobesus litoralis]
MWRFILLCSLYIHESVAQEISFDQLRFVTVNEPPANYLDIDDQIDGYVVEIVQQLRRRLEIDTEIELLPEARALKTLNTLPHIVMFSISRTPEREDKYHWLLHVINKRWIFYSRSDSQLDISTFKQVHNIDSIGVIRGDIREKWLKDKGVKGLVHILDYENAIKMLVKSRINLLLFESYGTYSTLNKLGYSHNEVKVQYVAKASEVYIVMSKFEGSNLLADEIRKHLLSIHNSKKHIKRKKKWLDNLNKINKSGAWISEGILTY